MDEKSENRLWLCYAGAACLFFTFPRLAGSLGRECGVLGVAFYGAALQIPEKVPLPCITYWLFSQRLFWLNRCKIGCGKMMRYKKHRMRWFSKIRSEAELNQALNE